MKAKIWRDDGGRYRVHLVPPTKEELDPSGIIMVGDDDGEHPGFDTPGDARRAAKRVVRALHALTGQALVTELVDRDPELEVEEEEAPKKRASRSPKPKAETEA